MASAEAVEASVAEGVATAIRRFLGEARVVGVDVTAGHDSGGDPALFAEVTYSGPSPTGATMLDATVAVQTAVRGLGDERFVYITFGSQDDRVVR